MPEFTSYGQGVPSWVDLAWSDLPAAHRFYQGLFGWELQAGPPEAGGYAMFTKGGKLVCGVGPKMAGPEQASAWSTYVNVEDADDTAARVNGAGGQVLFGPMQVLESGKLLSFLGADGSVCGAWQPGTHKGADLANEPGTFCWNELHSRDTAEAREFYAAVFGWQSAAQDMGGVDYTIFEVGGAPVAGMVQAADEVPPEGPSHWLVYFAVESCDDACAKATELGASMTVPPVDSPVGRFSVLADPEGALFALIQFPEGAGEAAPA